MKKNAVYSYSLEYDGKSAAWNRRIVTGRATPTGTDEDVKVEAELEIRINKGGNLWLRCQDHEAALVILEDARLLLEQLLVESKKNPS